MKSQKNQKGASAILISFFIMAVFFLVAMTAGTVTLLQVKMNREIAYSVPAFYAANAALEKCLYQVYQTAPGGTECASLNGTFSLNLSNGAQAAVTRTSSTTAVSIGTFRGVKRVVEANW